MKNKELVSRIEQGLSAVNKDSYIPRRHILSVATGKAIFLMAQKFRTRSLHRESNLYKTIECFELVEIDKYKCDVVEFRSCNTVMKSKNKLPKLVHFKYGDSIKEVTNIDFTLDFKRTTPSKYRRDKKRIGYKDDFFFYVKDGYLYLPNVEVSRVSVYLYTPNEFDIIQASSCNKKCIDPWELEFNCSDKITDVAITETIKELMSRVQIPVDENPNMDSNIKSKTIN